MESPLVKAVISYDPREQFRPYHHRSERWAVIVAHRRAGKTVATINDLIWRAIHCDKPEGRYAYIAPLFNQAKDVAWMYLKRYAEPLLASPPNETELRVDLVNGARIRLYGADNPDRLRGLYLDGVVLDEYADMHPGVWGEVIRPLLSDRQGHATFIGTPKGRNAFFEMFNRGETDPEWMSLILRAEETGIIPEAELESARRDMTPEQYNQEFSCSFDAAIIGAYFGQEVAQAEREGRIRDLPYEPALPVYSVWDIGRADATAVWFWQTVRDEIRVIDYYEAAGKVMTIHAKEVQSRPYKTEVDFVPHDAKVIEWTGDGRARIETMRGVGLNPKLVTDHKKMDGINAARVLFPRMVFDEAKCRLGLEALRQYRREYDDKTRQFKLEPKHDWTSHGADAFRYMAMAYKAMRPEPEPKAPTTPKGVADMTFNQLLASQPKKRNRV